MKKNKMMRLASVLLIAVLMSTCAISGTFAKYVTSNEASDSARVAKWGVIATVKGNAFGTEYALDDNNYTVTSHTVVSSNSDKLLAPGTNGSFYGVSLEGTPEVAVRVDYTGTVVEVDGWSVDGNFYCPLVFNVNGTVIEGISFNSADDLKTAIYNAIVKGAGDYQPKTDLSTIDSLNGEYTWDWAFETGANDVEKALNNKKDTALADAEAASGVPLNVVSIKVVITITQID